VWNHSPPKKQYNKDPKIDKMGYMDTAVKSNCVHTLSNYNLEDPCEWFSIKNIESDKMSLMPTYAGKLITDKVSSIASILKIVGGVVAIFIPPLGLAITACGFLYAAFSAICTDSYRKELMSPKGATWKDILRYSVKRILQQSIYMAISIVVPLGVEADAFNLSEVVKNLDFIPFDSDAVMTGNESHVESIDKWIGKKFTTSFFDKKVLGLNRTKYSSVEKLLNASEISSLYNMGMLVDDFESKNKCKFLIQYLKKLKI